MRVGEQEQEMGKSERERVRKGKENREKNKTICNISLCYRGTYERQRGLQQLNCHSISALSSRSRALFAAHPAAEGASSVLFFLVNVDKLYSID
jgi:hypothetical protein